jgi:hypothetical protein
MLRLAVAIALALPGLMLAAQANAQPDETPSGDAAAREEEPLTAERIIEVARERLRPPGVRQPCKLPESPNEIVVCRRDPAELRVESETDRAIAEGRALRDGVARAPNVDGPGIFQGKGIPLGGPPEPALIVDLSEVPEGLSEEDAALVYRVEDGPPRELPPVSGTPAAP